MLLITGSCGFIGSNLVHYLHEQGRDDVVCLDNLSIGSSLGRIAGIPGVRFHREDLTWAAGIEKIFMLYDITEVIHLAAASHVDRSISGDHPFWMTNVVGTANLLRACREHKVKKVIVQITDEFYGEKPPGTAALEGDMPMPTSPYPCSKVGQYYVGRTYFQTYDLPVLFTFPVNCYGPRQHEEKLIPKFSTRLLQGKKVPLMASSHFERDWLPVIDMCRALELLLDKGEPGQDYNVGADNHHTNLQLTHKLLELTGRDENFIEVVPDRAAHDSRYAVNYDKLITLGYKPSQAFDEYLALTVDWYRKELKL